MNSYIFLLAVFFTINVLNGFAQSNSDEALIERVLQTLDVQPTDEDIKETEDLKNLSQKEQRKQQKLFLKTEKQAQLKEAKAKQNAKKAA